MIGRMTGAFGADDVVGIGPVQKTTFNWPIMMRAQL